MLITNEKSNNNKEFRHSIFFGIVSQDDFEKPFKKFTAKLFFKPCKYYKYFFLCMVFQQEDEHEMGPAESKCQEDFMSLCIAFNAVHFPMFISGFFSILF